MTSAPRSSGQRLHLLAKPLRVVDDVIRAHLPAHRELLVGAGRGDHGGAQELADIHRGQPDAAGGAEHQQHVAGPQAAALQAVVGGAVAGPESGRGLEAHRCRQRRDPRRGHDGLVGKPSRYQHPIAGRDALDPRPRLQHDARGFAPGNERQLALRLVLPGNHQHVDEAHAAGVERHLHLSLCRRGRRHLAQHETLGAAQLFTDDRSHRVLLAPVAVSWWKGERASWIDSLQVKSSGAITRIGRWTGLCAP